MIIKNREFSGLSITRKKSIVSPDDGIICQNILQSQSVVFFFSDT
jgi:hypothetical protein